MRFSFAFAAAAASLFASAAGNADAACAGAIGAGASYSTTSTDVTLSEGCLMDDGKVDENMGGITMYSVTASACPGCILTDSRGATFIEPAADLGCDMNEVNVANPCVTSSSITTTTTTETTSDMSDMSDQMPPTITASCPDTHKPRCYCASATGSTNQNCDPTVRITHIAAETDIECADYCVSECGEGAGSNFACHPNDDPLMPCNEKTTSCECSSCETDAPPEPIQFGGQCGAFCAAECDGGTGYAYSCPAKGGTSAAPKKIGVVAGSMIVAIAVASLVV